MLACAGYERSGTDVISNRLRCTWMRKKGRQYERYSVTAITLRYIFTQLYNASTLWRQVISFDSYRSRHMQIVIAS